MPNVARVRVQRSRSRYLRFLLGLVLLVGVLYFGKSVIVPLALAVLFTFILTPVVMWVQRWGIGRVPAVLLAVGLALALAGCVGWGVGIQVLKLAQDMPTHHDQVQAKLERLRGTGAGRFSRLLAMFHDVGKSPETAAAATPSSADPTTKPSIVVAPAQSSDLARLSSVAVLVLEPIADAGLVLILVIFMLIRREDLRNRIIGLLGHGRLTGTTRVLVDTAQRLGRFLLMQVCVNAGFGFVFGLALLLIGVPYWFLWGFLAFVLRFVPYIGSWMAAAMPILLTIAIAPGWFQPLLVLGVFLLLDLITANAIEPLLFGHSTGVSPVALLVAAVFWTWVWGPVGLVLSTPLTVCLVVLGHQVPRLRFLSLLLGDEPALAPHVGYYQRLLAGDRAEAHAVARAYAESQGRERVADDVLLPAMLLARRDRKVAGLRVEDEAFIFDATGELLDSLAPPAAAPSSATEQAPSGMAADPAVHDAAPVVLGCPAHHRSEELSLRMLAAELASRGYPMEVMSTRALPVEIEARIRRDQALMLVLAVMPPGGVVQARYLCRRLRRRFPELKIVVGYWGKVKDFDKLLVRLRSAGASYVTTSILQTRGQILSMLPSTRAPGAAASATIEAPPAIAAS